MTPELSLLDLTIAGLLLLINGTLSLALGLGLERALLVAVVRLVVQLSLMGLVLKALFATMSPGWTALAAGVMVLFAGREIRARQRRPLTGGWGYGLGTACMLAAAVSVTVFALATSVRPDPWYDPRYALPLLGMVLGNTMTGISLGLDSLANALVGERVAVEARLALGGTRWQATGPVTRRALTTALMPIINSMAATGLVFLPGMMTGQILAGADPQQAVRYQILIMFLIAGGTALGAGGAVMGGVWRLTDGRHRLRLERLRGEGRR
ncbi:MAG: iron export ABC transporter permease subunit FetB [Candidatus Competibacteraceae bacterium]|nr:iron export ABC transporter permease subunit FetB [Candidatus Competibacteraceae bacterium]